MNDCQIQIVQDKLEILGAMVDCAKRCGMDGQSVTVKLRGVSEIIGEIEDTLRSESGENLPKTDEEVLRCAEVLYAGAKKGFFNRNESVEYLNDSIEDLKGVLQRTTRMKRTMERIKRSSLQYLKETRMENPFVPFGKALKE